MSNIYKIVDTSDLNYPLIDGAPFNKFDAGGELKYQVEKYFSGMFIFEEVSSRIGKEGMKESLLRCRFATNVTSDNVFYIYALEIESGGRSLPKEHRIQFRHNTLWNPHLADNPVLTYFNEEENLLENKECYVIGISKSGIDDHNVVFCSFHPSNIVNNESNNIETQATSSKSIQITVDKIQEAYINNISFQHKGTHFNVIIYKPQYLLWYMANRDELHLADIQKVQEMIDKAKKMKEFLPAPPTPQITDNVQELVLSAIRTKPFILLAGISGTGKSRIVRELAFKSCPQYLQDKGGTTPGNYCMIEVKPNWHDSTELLGYYSNLSNSYQFKKFVKFLVKAKMYPEVPFFVCLDEMNLAPVEQYFAEILSILETRKHPKNGEAVDMSKVKTEVIIDASYFRKLSEMPLLKNTQTGVTATIELTDRDIYLKLFDINTREAIEKEKIAEEVGKRYDLTTEGLTLPDNVIIIGTVNMDDTTHQFSRKVIDRAMTIEMNGGNLRNMFGGSKNLEYLPEEKQKEWQQAFTRRYVTADEVLYVHSEIAKEIIEKLPTRLEEINKALKGTPFEVSYRVLNELTIMVGVMIDANKDQKELDDIINQAINNILLMKILPRIEGDAEIFALSKEYKAKMGVSYNDRLEWLKELAPDIQDKPKEITSEDVETADDKQKEHQQKAKNKIQEMIDRLKNQEFTRYWP
jgi:5-methylcytosine-specific restriction related enzyme